MTTHQIYFAQHGLAVNKAENPDRPLSEAGIKQTEAIAKYLQRSAIPVAQISHSGKLRALQTAQIFAAELNITAVSAIDHLSPNDAVTLLAQNLQTDVSTNKTLYIGHLPHLEKLVSFLVTGKENPGILQFQNSAVVCLEKKETLYQLQWYLTPDLVASSVAK
jgi:phosphohistidine phosphatase